MLEILINFSLFILGCIFLYYASDSLINQSALISNKAKSKNIVKNSLALTRSPQIIKKNYKRKKK